MNPLQKFFAFLQLREAVRKADKAHAVSGHRFYVMPSVVNGRRKLLILDRANFRLLKQKRYISGRPFVRDLVAECFYSTPYANGSASLTPSVVALKRRQYFDWVEKMIREDKKNGKNKWF